MDLGVQARALGFDLCRVTSADAPAGSAEHLDRWIDSGAAGDMAWMRETRARRGDPKALWPDVKSIVMLGMNYGPAENPLANLDDKTMANVSVYARHRDYHELIKGRLKHLAAWLIAQTEEADVKVFVDTAPVMEKPLAQKAGLGWQGKHTNLVARDFGSWLFLGAIFTTLPLEPDAQEEDHCGTCQACLDICPTQAFAQPYVLDARRCISYLTIEHKGFIAREFRAAIGNRIYGCDDCLAVCPWNKFAQNASEAKLQARADLVQPAIVDWLAFDEMKFRSFFSGNPVKRIGISRFMRNLLIAAGNSQSSALMPAVEAKLSDPSPLVRGMAIWALSRLSAADIFERLAHHWLPGEDDAQVRTEWQAGLIERGETIET
jgi:epoxyqueuosine reductase